MKYKIGDSFLIPVEVHSIDESRIAPYFISGCAGIGWWSEKALDEFSKMACADCKYKGKRHQKCSCCIRNRNMKDCYESEE